MVWLWQGLHSRRGAGDKASKSGPGRAWETPEVAVPGPLDQEIVDIYFMIRFWSGPDGIDDLHFWEMIPKSVSLAYE